MRIIPTSPQNTGGAKPIKTDVARVKYLLLFLAILVCPAAQAEKWKTYRDAKLGIEFQYPPDWNCTWEETNKPTLMVKPDREKPPYVAFQL